MTDDLPALIRAYRARERLSLAGFAVRLSQSLRMDTPIDRGTVYRWERGTRSVDALIAGYVRWMVTRP